MMSKKLVVLMGLLGTAVAAQANAGGLFGWDPFQPPVTPPFHKEPAAAPEIDPASAMSAFTLLAGGLVMIRGRRASKSDKK